MWRNVCARQSGSWSWSSSVLGLSFQNACLFKTHHLKKIKTSVTASSLPPSWFTQTKIICRNCPTNTNRSESERSLSALGACCWRFKSSRRMRELFLWKEYVSAWTTNRNELLAVSECLRIPTFCLRQTWSGSGELSLCFVWKKIENVDIAQLVIAYR